MQCYSELVPSAGITQAIALPFTAATAHNLIIGRTSLLQIFTHVQSNHGQDTKLVLVAEYHLSGTITAFGRVNIQTTKSGGEALLIAFRDAKLSLVEWDPAQHSVSTISIHYYENYDLQTAPWMPVLQDCVNRLTVDPGSRCAAFNFGVSSLAIIPFHQAQDDLAMDDFDDMDDDHRGKSPMKQINGTEDHSTPYFPSFVLPVTMLDPGLTHPVDLAFLHEYRDPTIGILYSSVARSENMSFERKDVTTYAVYAFDLEQKASTTLQSVPNLPNDLHSIIALPLPVGGALLVGGNELIHIDQGGKASAIGVNEFAREASAFPMADHAEYRMRLEGCRIEQLGNPNGEMMIVLNTGELVLLSFRLDGRSVSGMALRRLDDDSVRDMVRSSSSCTAHIGHGRIFVGSEQSASVLLGTMKRGGQPRRQSSRGQYVSQQQNGVVEEHSEGDVDPDDDDDDLYGTAATVNGSHDNSTVTSNSIRLLDQLSCIAPLNDVTFGRSLKRKREDDEDDGEDNPTFLSSNRLELAVACGRGRAGGVAFFSRQLHPNINKTIDRGNVIGVWSFSTENTQSPEVGQTALHDHLILSETGNGEKGQSSLWTISEGDIQIREGSEFDGAAGATIQVGRLSNTNHTAQVTATEVRVYDAEFGLSQIFPIVDEEEGTTAKAIRASFSDPYLVILKEDNTISILRADRSGELDEINLPPNLSNQSIIAANFYTDTKDFFQTSRFRTNRTAPAQNIILSLLASDGVLRLLSLYNANVQVFQADGLDFLPLLLAQDAQLPKHWRNKDELSEVIIADLGDGVDQQPYLIIRNTTGDIIVYQPFAIPTSVGTYKFKKVLTRTAEVNPDDNEGQQSFPPLQVLHDISGYWAVFVPGPSPKIILKRASSAPYIYDFDHPNVKSLCVLQDEIYGHDLIFVNEDGDLCIGEIPHKAILGQSDWVIQKVDLHQDITTITYFEPTQSYVLGANYPTEFRLPSDDEWHPEWQKDNTQFLPTTMQSTLKLMSSRTHSIISQHHFDSCERILCVKTMNLEVSEETHERKDLIVVGTAVTKGENVVTRGNLYIFDVVDVVPQPDVPETDLKLKLITKEDVRGAVTAISEIGSQGFVLAVQGQKCMVRGLKEDMSILPVAFLDMRYYVQVAKELKGTGLCVLGDAFSGMWLTGYSEEPYKMQLLGRDLENPEVMTAEFLPDGKQLYIITSDGDGQLRILQYDPEDPKAERGTKLLPRTTFNTGSFPTTMTLLPRTPVSSELPSTNSTKRKRKRSRSSSASYNPDSENASESDSSMSLDVPQTNPNTATQQILVTTSSGSIALITPLSDATYRRLSTLQNILITNLEHPCSLNPRAYRQVETDGIGGRGMIDGNIVKRWLEQSGQHKASTADKVGGTVWEVRSDLEGVGGAGLGFL